MALLAFFIASRELKKAKALHLCGAFYFLFRLPRFGLDRAACVRGGLLAQPLCEIGLLLLLQVDAVVDPLQRLAQ